jgi:aarF domain-containing kinase
VSLTSIASQLQLFPWKYFLLDAHLPEEMSSRIAGLCPRSIKCRYAYTFSTSAQHVPQSQILNLSRAYSRFTHKSISSNHFKRPSISNTLGVCRGRTSTRSLQTQRYQPLVPPSPESLGKAAPAKEYKRSIKWGRRLLNVCLVTGTLYFIDSQFYASSITRSLRTFGLGVVVAADYKLNFRPEPWFGGDIVDLHARNAERLFNLLHQNGGLYLKIGQAIAMQSAVLPPEFQKMFAKMFDDAPQNSWSDVEKVIREDFGGKSPEEVFGVSFSNERGKGVMEKRARASASVAQVHWARLEDGREVAIKIQKREIAQQVGWDLWAFQ